MVKIAIIGPECTGKTTLCHQLADYYNTLWIPEYARQYIENVHRKYTYEDVEKIAEYQFQQICGSEKLNLKYVFFDTELIISKIWFNIVFNKEPSWLDTAIRNSNFQIYLLCNTDIPWEADSVRENGGQMREKLFDIYKKTLIQFNLPFSEIEGTGSERLQNATYIVNKLEGHSRS